jgi:hypothetical protein
MRATKTNFFKSNIWFKEVYVLKYLKKDHEKKILVLDDEISICLFRKLPSKNYEVVSVNMV